MSNKMLTLNDRLELMTEAEHAALIALHNLLVEIKKTPEKRVGMLRDPVQFIEDIEYTLQGIWGFSRDVTYHTHWMEIKGCTCPKMDNRDPMYRGRGKIVVADCPWHWNK